MTAITSCPASLNHFVITRRGATRAVVTICVGMLLCSPIPEASAVPTVDEVMKELRLSESDKEKVRQGEIVDWKPTEGSDRELALGMVFMAKGTPENLASMYRQVMILKDVSVITAHGTITGEGSMEQLAGLALKPNAEKEAKRYLKAKPGDELNLDAKEMAPFGLCSQRGKMGLSRLIRLKHLSGRGCWPDTRASIQKGGRPLRRRSVVAGNSGGLAMSYSYLPSS